MTALRKSTMTGSEFLAWAIDQPGRWELIDGEPVAMSPERVVHSQTKHRVARALDASIQRAGVSCHFLPDGVLVPIDDSRKFQPDAMVYCGPVAPPNALEIQSPVVVVEVLSPSSVARDLRDKLAGYFLVPSIMHYLIVDTDKRLVIHHRRTESAIETRILTSGGISLEPPGLALALNELLPE
jgi:Uma2 family endonuclease